jgi:hypothetical protein
MQGTTSADRTSSKADRPQNKERKADRETVTFRAYYWEAYNEVVQPRAIGRYLVRRWLPDLGTNGYAIVQVLRDRAYHNPQTGELRNDVFVESMADLARACGLSESTLRREFAKNAALAEFVRKAPAYQPSRRPAPFGRTVEKAGTVYWVAMDDPIHPADEARYQRLKQQKEMERGDRKTGASGIPTAVLLAMRGAPSPFAQAEMTADFIDGQPAAGYTGQIDRYRSGAGSMPITGQIDRYSRLPCQNDSPERQNDGAACQNDSPERQNDRYLNKVSPSLSLPLGTSGTAALPPSHTCVPPEGDPRRVSAPGPSKMASEEVEPACPLAALWHHALGLLADRVNKPTLEAHLRPLVLASVEDDGTALLLAPHAATRDWIEKRHLPAIQDALAEVLGRPVPDLRLRLAADHRDAKHRD